MARVIEVSQHGTKRGSTVGLMNDSAGTSPENVFQKVQVISYNPPDASNKGEPGASTSVKDQVFRNPDPVWGARWAHFFRSKFILVSCLLRGGLLCLDVHLLFVYSQWPCFHGVLDDSGVLSFYAWMGVYAVSVALGWGIWLTYMGYVFRRVHKNGFLLTIAELEDEVVSLHCTTMITLRVEACLCVDIVQLFLTFLLCLVMQSNSNEGYFRMWVSCLLIGRVIGLFFATMTAILLRRCCNSRQQCQRGCGGHSCVPYSLNRCGVGLKATCIVFFALAASPIVFYVALLPAMSPANQVIMNATFSWPAVPCNVSSDGNVTAYVPASHSGAMIAVYSYATVSSVKYFTGPLDIAAAGGSSSSTAKFHCNINSPTLIMSNSLVFNRVRLQPNQPAPSLPISLHGSLTISGNVGTAVCSAMFNQSAVAVSPGLQVNFSKPLVSPSTSACLDSYVQSTFITVTIISSDLCQV